MVVSSHVVVKIDSIVCIVNHFAFSDLVGIIAVKLDLLENGTFKLCIWIICSLLSVLCNRSFIHMITILLLPELLLNAFLIGDRVYKRVTVAVLGDEGLLFIQSHCVVLSWLTNSCTHLVSVNRDSSYVKTMMFEEWIKVLKQAFGSLSFVYQLDKTIDHIHIHLEEVLTTTTH